MTAEVTQVKNGRIFVSVIRPPIDDADIVIELHRSEKANEQARPTDVRFMVLTREEFRILLDDWIAFDRNLK